MRPHPGELLRAARERHGVSQRRLAIRAGTRQAAISRIERGEQSPTVQRLEELLLCLGEELVLDGRPLAHTADPRHLLEARERSPVQRVERALEWNEFAASIGGQAAKRELEKERASRR